MRSHSKADAAHVRLADSAIQMSMNDNPRHARAGAIPRAQCGEYRRVKVLRSYTRLQSHGRGWSSVV